MNVRSILPMTAADVDAESSPSRRIVRPGVNCWRSEPAPRAAVMVDAADYFSRLDASLRKARRSILIVGWDFDGRIRLRPDLPGSESLGALLRRLVEEMPDLEVRILVWSVAVIHAPGASAPLLFGTDWERHPRITVKLDTQHPFYAAHHQKLVVLDDELAFVGGIDLTVRRWDTCRHAADDPERLSYDGSTYGPVHDVHMVVDGAAARAVGMVVRERWRVATDEALPPRSSGADLWPDGLEPGFRNQSIAIARAAPPWRGARGLREAAALTRDAILGTRRRLYIEAQYFTARYVRDAVLALLRRPDPPEIVVILTKGTEGWGERIVMGSNGDRTIRRLKREDRFDRVRFYYPVSPRSGPSGGLCSILVHSKLVIVDDVFLRVGSSNFNNRSVGLDTECDIAIEAADPAARAAIADLRNHLIGEHLGLDGAAFAARLARHGGLIAAIEAETGPGRRLQPFASMTDGGPWRNVLGTWLLDPARPFEPFWFLRWRRRRPVRSRKRRTHGITN